MPEVFLEQGLTGRGGRKMGHWVKITRPLFPGGEGLAEIRGSPALEGCCPQNPCSVPSRLEVQGDEEAAKSSGPLFH